MAIIVKAVILGILTGGIYALMASGLTLIFGVMKIVNIAQAILVMLGAYLSFVVQRYLRLDMFISLLITMPIMFAIGMAIEWIFIRKLKKDRMALSILVTYALALLIEGVLIRLFSANYIQLSASYIDASFSVLGFYFSYVYLFLFILSVVLIASLYVLVYRTKFGYGLRALMLNSTGAALIGIDVERISAITFGIGVALAAAGGMAYGATNLFNAASSYDLISRLLVIIVLGGMGSLNGALIASIALVTIGDITAVVWSPTWSSTIFYILLVVLLSFRPQGLFGQVEGRKQ